jgi:ABC-type uncharacterized transport system substrate-binding protein
MSVSRTDATSLRLPFGASIRVPPARPQPRKLTRQLVAENSDYDRAATLGAPGFCSAHIAALSPISLGGLSCFDAAAEGQCSGASSSRSSAAGVAWPQVARAQQRERMRRIGIVMPFAKGDSEGEARIGAFKQELAKLGWTDRGNIQFDERWPADNMDLVRSHAASLVASNPDIIVVSGGRIVPVLMRLTRSIPIVLPGATDPVGVGWAQSLARPGGNVTGFTAFELAMLGKSLEILKQIAAAVIRVGLIYNPDNPNSVYYRRISEGASARLAIETVDHPIHALADIERAITSLAPTTPLIQLIRRSPSA